ncbi:HAD family hydrolase [Treponema phagedenis]|uniref:HAD hydrolase, family IA, variant 1 n=1 Tax=Treponema phagedenis TaxID=162 RepID=A0A0B7GYL2_TREPH|nr:HAD family hydrolase [Treponema phagedenis]NVP25201.1 HAD family hydrolase [Treponema phagedenis]QEJ95937.1 HAD family hydrolase [Treponema phagedenis]QEK00364.1 HAD family hydrolase [Treponema phagedenis]QEK02487.1 HAD family hydrolase [Treponema phagedenis]QEK05373.1 HAD family hydrolase [Treponema phagedenis]
MATLIEKLKIVKAVAFDIDGTLYPEEHFFLRITPFMIRHLKLMIAFGEVRKKLRKLQIENPEEPLADFFDLQATLIAEKTGKDAKAVKNFIETEIYQGWKKYFDKVKPFPHMLQTIKTLKAHGYKIALLSDFPPSQKNDVWGVLPLCDAALGTEEVGALKPSPLSFYALAEKLKLPCNQILYIGNNNYDVEGAKAAGCMVGIQSGFSRIFGKRIQGADFFFSDYRQLLQYMIQ